MKHTVLWGMTVLAALPVLGAVKNGSDAGLQVVEAQRFVLKNVEGKVRAELSTARNNEPKLWFYGEDGKRRIEVSLLSDGTAGVWLLDRQERIRAGLSMMEEEPSLRLRDQDGRDRINLSLIAEGEPSLFLWGRNGQALWSAPALPER